MKIQYKKLLDLELWHDYYIGQLDISQPLPENYDISSVLALVPTSDCQQRLSKLRWKLRSQRYGAILFAEVEPDRSGHYQPKIALDRPESFSFWLVVRDPRFANFTNLPLTPLSDRIYHFSNRSRNSQGKRLFLSRPLPSYQSRQAYQLGQMVTHAQRTWEAIRDSPTGETASQRPDSHADPPSEDWEALPLSQYVSQQDQLRRQGLAYTCTVPQVNPDDVLQFELINENQQKLYTTEFTVPKTHRIGDAIALPLTFPNLAPSCYRLLLQGQEIDKFILADPLSSYDVWGLVEIVLNPSLVPSEFALVRAENHWIQPQAYMIRFKNRATYWRYRYERPHGFAPDLLRTLNLHYETDKIYRTQRPQGLLQRPNRLFTDGKDRLLPAPKVAQIKPEARLDPETQKSTIAIFSDIYL